MGKLDVENRTYTTDNGLKIVMTPVSGMLLGAMSTDETGKPTVPITEVTLAGTKRLQENPDDPAYAERLETWEKGRSMLMMRYVFAKGTNIPPDPTWIEEMGSYIPNPTNTNLRVYWLFEQLTNDEASELFETIMSLSMPTEKGLALSADRFQSSD